jgi:hypothetical protein
VAESEQRRPPLDLGQIQDAPIDAPAEADFRTRREEDDWENQALAEALREQIQETNQRKTFADRIFWLVVGWLSAIFTLLILHGTLSPWGLFSIGNSVLVALIGGTTVNVIAVLFVVMRYLFPHRIAPATRRGRSRQF